MTTIFTALTSLSGGTTVTTPTENVASFGSGPEGRSAYGAWIRNLGTRGVDAVVVDQDGNVLFGDVGQLVEVPQPSVKFKIVKGINGGTQLQRVTS